MNILPNKTILIPALVALCLGLQPLVALAADNPEPGKQAGAQAREAAGAVAKEQKEKPAEAKTAAGEADKNEAGGETRPAGEGEPVAPFGFLDRDRDGRNDLFVDANGDGFNDINGKTYPHTFKFLDADGNGLNDVFQDADGDGVNDLDTRFADEDSDGINDNVVDTNHDYVNDITGLRFSRKSLRGYKFGFIKEERQMLLRGFIDEDADGIPDARQQRMSGGEMRGRDRFIDRDGDGIDDRRQSQKRLRRGPMGGKP